MSRTPPGAADAERADGYGARSRQPLAILAFLLPLVLGYEIGLAILLRTRDGVLTNKAHETLLAFFDAFGINASGGLFLGGAVIVAVLLAWHLLNRDPWRIDPAVPAIMWAESIGLAVPLIVLGVVVASREPMAAGAGDLTSLGLSSQLAISIGAGLYEELLFRMLLIALLHTLLVDVARIDGSLGTAIAIVVSAAAFSLYHRPGQVGAALFYFLAGLYFAGVFVWRGFGIVVGAHAFYDIIVVLMMRAAD